MTAVRYNDAVALLGNAAGRRIRPSPNLSAAAVADPAHLAAWPTAR